MPAGERGEVVVAEECPRTRPVRTGPDRDFVTDKGGWTLREGGP